jgi:hypothetical protein
MSGDFLRALAENEDTLDTGLDVHGVYLEDEEKQQLTEAIQEIVDRLSKP